MKYEMLLLILPNIDIKYYLYIFNIFEITKQQCGV